MQSVVRFCSVAEEFIILFMSLVVLFTLNLMSFPELLSIDIGCCWFLSSALACNLWIFSYNRLTLVVLILVQIKTIHNNIFSEMITQLVRRRPEYATLALKVWCFYGSLNMKFY